MKYQINNVTLLYPRLNEPYKFDERESRSVACDALDEGAAYDVSFVLSEEQASELNAACMQAWKEAAEVDTKRRWPEKPTLMPYKHSDKTDQIVGKAKLKAAYKGKKTRMPVVVDASNQRMEHGFEIPNGSKGNVAVTIVAYNTGAVNGVTLRLRGVQILELGEATDDKLFTQTAGYAQEVSVHEPQEGEESELPF